MSGFRAFVIQISTTPNDEASWQRIGFSTSTRYTAKGLVRGSQYWFRVAAFGTAGEGPFSDPALQMAG